MASDIERCSMLRKSDNSVTLVTDPATRAVGFGEVGVFGAVLPDVRCRRGSPNIGEMRLHNPYLATNPPILAPSG